MHDNSKWLNAVIRSLGILIKLFYNINKVN